MVIPKKISWDCKMTLASIIQSEVTCECWWHMMKPIIRLLSVVCTLLHHMQTCTCDHSTVAQQHVNLIDISCFLRHLAKLHLSGLDQFVLFQPNAICFSSYWVNPVESKCTRLLGYHSYTCLELCLPAHKKHVVVVPYTAKSPVCPHSRDTCHTQEYPKIEKMFRD